MTKCLPPPESLPGLLNVMPGTGRWVVEKAGSGTFAIRAEFRRSDGTAVIARTQDEIKGYAGTVATAMKFAIGIATAGTHYWYAT